MARVSGTPVGSSALTVLHDYAADFRAGRYAAMWTLLTPTARAGWGDLAGYSSYYRVKFAPIHLLGVSFGAARGSGATVHVPLSLNLAWRVTGPPGVLSLFKNLERLSRSRGAGAWLGRAARSDGADYPAAATGAPAGPCAYPDVPSYLQRPAASAVAGWG